MKIYIDASCDILYSSFYIEGIRRFPGVKSMAFTSKHFREFKHNNHFFALVVKTKNRESKVIIDFADATTIDTKAYDWCDIYAKINIAFEDAPKYDKLFSIGPGFGIQIFSKAETLYYAVSNYLKSRKRIPNPRRFFSDYKAQINRFKPDQYRNTESSRNDYIYFASSLWKLEPETNAYRANFMKAAKSIPAITFDGGFAPRKKNDIPGFEDLTMAQRENVSGYIGKMKASLAVFNTPAVLKCHGWKLGEFFALGKAIISTPISRILPKELCDNEDFLVTDGTQPDIESKIKRLLAEPGLKDRLEKASRDYYTRFLAPEKVMSSIFAKLDLSENGN